MKALALAEYRGLEAIAKAGSAVAARLKALPGLVGRGMRSLYNQVIAAAQLGVGKVKQLFDKLRAAASRNRVGWDGKLFGLREWEVVPGQEANTTAHV